MKPCTSFVLLSACYWAVLSDSGISVTGPWGLCMCNFIAAAQCFLQDCVRAHPHQVVFATRLFKSLWKVLAEYPVTLSL